MKNLTITVDEETAAWVRVYAARRRMSVSRMVGEMLQQRMQEHGEYESAMRRFLAFGPVKLRRRGARHPSRDSLHDRDRFR